MSVGLFLCSMLNYLLAVNGFVLPYINTTLVKSQEQHLSEWRNTVPQRKHYHRLSSQRQGHSSLGRQQQHLWVRWCSLDCLLLTTRHSTATTQHSRQTVSNYPAPRDHLAAQQTNCQQLPCTAGPPGSFVQQTTVPAMYSQVKGGEHSPLHARTIKITK